MGGRDMDLQMLRRLFVTTAVVLGFAPSAVQACSCVLVSNSCGVSKAFSAGGVIFLGQVVFKIKVQEPASLGNRAAMVPRYAVHFTVKENFHGASDLGQEIVVHTGLGGGDCGYPFVVGTSYLVYASTSDRQLTTGICSGTKPEVMVGGLLKELRAARDGTRFDDLFGTIGIGPTVKSPARFWTQAARAFLALSQSGLPTRRKPRWQDVMADYLAAIRRTAIFRCHSWPQAATSSYFIPKSKAEWTFDRCFFGRKMTKA